MQFSQISTEQVLNIFKETGALLEGHFLLTSGLHSPKYFQCAKVLQYPEYAEILCRQISRHFYTSEVELVISPAIGGIIVGYEVARQLEARNIFAERESGVMKLRRGFEIKQGERVLVCEDVITTGGSVFEVIDLVKSAGGKLIGVGCIVDRSGGKIDFGTRFAAVIRLEVPSFKPEECPLCKEGAELIKPGSRGIY